MGFAVHLYAAGCWLLKAFRGERVLLRDAVRCSWQDWGYPRSLPIRTSAEADHVDEIAVSGAAEKMQQSRRHGNSADFHHPRSPALGQ